jgi:alpha-1,3-mannosyltransferase
VLHVVRQYAPAVGGLENFVACLVAEQRNAGLEAQVLTLNSVFHAPPAPPLPAQERLDGIPVRRLAWRGSHRYPLAPGVLRHLREFDLVHVHGVDFFADFLAATQFLHRRPLLLSTHGGFFHTAYASRLKRLFFHTVTRWSLRQYAHVFACSEGDFSTFQVIRPKGMTLIENGVDTEKFRGWPPRASSRCWPSWGASPTTSGWIAW